MTQETVISIAEQSVWTVLLVSGPLLIIALLTGLLVSIFQATTSIQEQTLSFVPKIIAVLVGLVFFGPWMLSLLTNYATNIFNDLVRFIG